MSYNTPQSLLGLPTDVPAPDAYRVLGIPALEADRAAIKSAGETRLARLNEAKSFADPQALSTAILWVKNAVAILSDPGKKAAYDRKLAAEKPAPAPVVDPLAGMLPTGPRKPAPPKADPVEEFLPQSQAAVGVAVAEREHDMPNSMPMAAPILRRSTTVKRRAPVIPIIMIAFSVLAIGGLGWLVYVVQQGKGGTIIINPNGGTILASGEAGGRMISPPSPVHDREKRPYDPVMGSLAGEVKPPPPKPAETEPAPAQSVATDMPAKVPSDEPMMTTPDPMAETTPVPAPETPMPQVPAPESPAPETPAPEMKPEPTPAQMEAGATAIAAASEAIKRYDWSNMKPLAEQATTAAAGEPQTELAEGLHQLADLATYYHGAIVKAYGSIKTGTEINLSNDVVLMVVEVAPEKLVVKMAGRIREFDSAKLPPPLAHYLAESVAVLDPTTALAAKLSYQAVAPGATPEIRKAVAAELEKITDEVEGAEPAKLAAAIRYLYSL